MELMIINRFRIYDLFFQYNATVNYKKTRDSAEFTQLLKLYEKDACVAIEKYLGNFLHTVEKACGMEPGKCPIEKVYNRK